VPTERPAEAGSLKRHASRNAIGGANDVAKRNTAKVSTRLRTSGEPGDANGDAKRDVTTAAESRGVMTKKHQIEF
jgi:hypothetical protein